MHRCRGPDKIFDLGLESFDLDSSLSLMRWSQLRFDFDSTAVRLLIKGH